MVEELKHLNDIKTTLSKYIIPYQVMTSWNRNSSEGFNDGIKFAIKKIDEKIKRYEKRNKK